MFPGRYLKDTAKREVTKWHAVAAGAPTAPNTAPTQQRQDAGEDGDERPGAEAGGQHVGLGVAGLRYPVRVTVTDADGEGVGAAERGRPTVHDEDGQVVHRLLLPPEAGSPGENGGCVVWEKASKAVSARFLMASVQPTSSYSSHSVQWLGTELYYISSCEYQFMWTHFNVSVMPYN